MSIGTFTGSMKGEGRKILVAPLNWGLGHATRCVPVIEQLLKRKFRVHLAAEARPLAFLRQRFPSLPCSELPGYSITYPEKGRMMLRMAASVPGIISGIRAEHAEADRLVEREGISGIISDNRFGLWSKRVPTVFITHQVSIRAPFAEELLFQVNRHYIRKFNFCWLPDFPGENNLSGELSHTRRIPLTARYTGPLSRFRDKVKASGNSLLVLLSGPEPQRSLLEKKVLEQLPSVRNKFEGFIFIRGIPGEKIKAAFSPDAEVHDHADDSEFIRLAGRSSLILCRPGYSTLMDLHRLGGKAVFIPTPGQTEQEYLGSRMMEMSIGLCIKQEKFNLSMAVESGMQYRGFEGSQADDTPLEAAMDEFLSLVEGKNKN